MKVETKLALNNMNKNKKRTVYTIISLILCTTLILTTMLLVSSIRNGVSENSNIEYNDYHVILKDLSAERFERIKNKTYIDKIYIQKNEDAPLEKANSRVSLKANSTIYLKYDNINKVCQYTDDIIEELNLSELEIIEIGNICKFNKKMLAMNGLIDINIEIQEENLKCMTRFNYSPIISLMVTLIIVIASSLFIFILYNAFLITINERKKEYAILNSVGGTEGQVLKMIFKEAIAMSVIGIIVGGVLSVSLSNIVLSNINNILNRAGYYFRLIIDIKYIMLALGIIVINIYFSILIPSLKASSTSVIQGIRNNKEIKNKKRKTILERILPTEGKVAIKNIRRNKSKYTLIMILLIINITTFISVTTYTKYERETANVIAEYDVDAEIPIITEENINSNNVNYKNIFKNYEIKYGKKIEYIEYKATTYKHFLVEPTSSIVNNSGVTIYNENAKSLKMIIIALDDNTYNKYIEKIHAKQGDIIIYNNVLYTNNIKNEREYKYNYSHAINPNANIKLTLIDTRVEDNENDLANNYYKAIETTVLDRECILTDEIIDGYNEVKSWLYANNPTLFVNMETYNKLTKEAPKLFESTDGYLRVKIKCDDIIELKNYIEEINEEQNLNFGIDYYTLENEYKLIYISLIEVILKVIMTAIIAIGIVSTANIMNASLIERKEDFNIMYRMGATKGNVKKILIYECIYVFTKAVVISIILSIPIIYKIIKGMENVLVLNKLLIPYGSIGIFISAMFIISLLITLWSTKMIKEE